MEMYDLLQCIERALDCYGSNTKQATYLALTMNQGISADRILGNPEALDRAINEVFGPAGSKLVERTIVKEIKKVFPDLEQPTSSYTIFEALDVASKSITDVPEPLVVS